MSFRPDVFCCDVGANGTSLLYLCKHAYIHVHLQNNKSKVDTKTSSIKKQTKKSVHKHRVNRNDALLLNIRDKHTFGRITFLSRAEQCVDTKKKCIRKRAYE